MDNILMRNTLGNIFKIANRSQSMGDSIDMDLSFKQWMVIIPLLNNPQKWLTLNDIADKAGVTRQSVKKMVQLLHEKGYVDMSPSDTDKRAYKIRVTKKSIKTFNTRKEELTGIMGDLFDGIDDKDLKTTNDVLLKIRGNMEQLSHTDE